MRASQADIQRSALITGANSGIGYATAQRLVDKGYQVHLLGRNRRSIEEAAQQLGAQAFVADMKHPEDLARVARTFVDSGLDALVNNAGIAYPSPIDTIDEDAFEEHFATNVRGPLLLTRYLLPALERRGGSIVNVSSVITHRSTPGFALYTATKGALEAATHTLALEMAPRGIRVNAVCPGAIDTPIFSKMGLPPQQLEQAHAQLLEKIPLGRFGRPDEVADVIVAQLEASYVTGSVWAVDGGVSA